MSPHYLSYALKAFLNPVRLKLLSSKSGAKLILLNKTKNLFTTKLPEPGQYQELVVRPRSKKARASTSIMAPVLPKANCIERHWISGNKINGDKNWPV